MTNLLLSVHVIAAILTIGPITVAASMFPAYARSAATVGDTGARSAGIAALLHRICRVYALIGIAVPVFGFATGLRMGVLTEPWLLASILLTVVAAAVLLLFVLPGQRRMLAPPDESGPAPARTASRLSGLTGFFNVLWVVVVILMVVRPGSAPGA